MDLEGMKLPPAAEEESSALDLSGEKGMEKEDEIDKPKVDLTAASDDEILKEAEARGLIEPEEAEDEGEAPEEGPADLPFEDEDALPPANT
jgi:hypothetical protein